MFDGVEVEYESEDFCKVKALIYIESLDDTLYDTVQIDNRNRDNTRLRFIVTNWIGCRAYSIVHGESNQLII